MKNFKFVCVISLIGLLYVIIIFVFVKGFYGVGRWFNFTDDQFNLAGVLLSSLLTGVFTLLVVYLTLENQRKEEQLKKLPRQIVDSWKINKKFAFIGALSVVIDDNPDLNDVELVDEFFNENEEWITDLSASINADMYSLVNTFFNHISDYSTYKNRNESKEWFNKARDYLVSMDRVINKLEKKYDKMR